MPDVQCPIHQDRVCPEGILEAPWPPGSLLPPTSGLCRDHCGSRWNWVLVPFASSVKCGRDFYGVLTADDSSLQLLGGLFLKDVYTFLWRFPSAN